MRIFQRMDLTSILNEIVSKPSTDTTVIQLDKSEHYFYFNDENPFSTIAYIIHSLSGRCDSELLEEFGGQKDLCPYGERIRTYNKSKELNFIFNPIDQLVDAYRKLKDGKEAVINIYNPYFDLYESESEFSENGAKNAVNALFSVKNGRLDLIATLNKTSVKTLFNDVLGIFHSLQIVLSRWIEKEVGTITLVVSEIDISGEKPMKFYKHLELELPEFDTSIEDTNDFLDILNKSGMIETLCDDNFIISSNATNILDTFKTIPDSFLKELVIMLFIYRVGILGNVEATVEGLKAVSGVFKVKALRYLYSYLKEEKEFKDLYKDMNEETRRYIENKRQRAF